MESPIAQPTYIFPAQEFTPHTLRCHSRAYYKPGFQDDPEDILESNTALLLAESIQNTCSTPLWKWQMLLLSYQNHGLSQEQAVDPFVHFIHHGCPKPVLASLTAWQKLKGLLLRRLRIYVLLQICKSKVFSRTTVSGDPKFEESLFKMNSFYC